MSGKGFYFDHQLSFWLCLLALASGSVFFSGCGSSGRQAIEGRVTLDGKPLEKGYVTLRPQSGTTSPSAGGDIVNGKFSIAPKGGLLPGNFRVEITASRRTDKKVMDPFHGKMMPLEEQFIPAMYNSESTLEAAVVSSGPNRFEFALVSENDPTALKKSTP